MLKKFEINPTKIKGGCQSGRKVVPHDSKSDLPLSSEKNESHVIYLTSCRLVDSVDSRQSKLDLDSIIP